jgi:uncharacterized protein YhaN
MKLVELSLIAFGSFEDERIDLSGDGPVLHVIYGPNEAGKSTALRAITGLLYGVAERTSDAYLHDTKALRVGGRLTFAGQELEVVRRKGRKNTLLDKAGAPTDEAKLSRALGGVSREQFLTMFGLDHRTLREGARALLRGDGGLGESLFDAGGAQGVGEVLAELRAEAEALFKPRGQNQPIAEALRSYREAGTNIVTRGVEAQGWVTQQEAVATTRKQRDDVVAERNELVAERRQLEQALRVLPKLAERAAVQAELDALGDAPRLAEDAPSRREQASAVQHECARDEARLLSELNELTAARDAIVVDEAVRDLDADRVAEMRRLRDRDRNAAADRPKRVAQRRERLEQAKHELAKLGRNAELEELDGLRVDKATDKRIKALAREVGALDEALAGAERRLRQTEHLLAALESELAALPLAREHRALQSALARAQNAGDLDAEVERSSARCAEVTSALRIDSASMPGFDGDAASLLALAVPSLEWVRAEAGAGLGRDERALSLQDRARELQLRGERTRVELEALTQQADVPTEAKLLEARRRRDTHLAGRKPKLDDYVAGVAETDELADRLRREADRVARCAQLEAELASQARARTALDDEQQALATDRQAADDAWNAAWAPVVAGPHDAMVDWLDRQRALIELAARLRSIDEQVATVVAARSATRASLADALTAAGEPVAEGGSLGPLLDAAQALVARLLDADTARRALQERMADQRRQLPGHEAERDEAAGNMARHRSAWAEGMRALDLAEDARVDEAVAVLEVLSTVQEHVAAASDYARRVAGMDRDAAEFSTAVRAWVESVAPDLAGESSLAAAEVLLARHAAAERAAARRDELSQRIDAKEAELSETRARAAQARGELEELARAAGVADPAELVAAEQRAHKRRDRDERLTAIERELYEHGLPLDELGARVGTVDLAQARDRVAAIERGEETLNELAMELERELATQQAGLERMRQREGAHRAAADRQASIAEIRRLAERYAVVKLAAVTLEQEVERYRELNEGPIIRRASAIFPELTLGEYQGVKTSYDERDEPELVCLGADDSEVPVDGLSDGARDQLYLALRLASLERYAEQAELMPFVADDILVHFDEDRAQAAMKVLQRFAATTQVLMFTHQARHVELAREAIDPACLTVHELRGGRRRARAG